MRSKTYIKITLLTTFVVLVLIAFINIYIDPFFHYHAPLENLSYFLDNERYQNNGIMRHFEYDAIITGTSMCDNFKTSECEQLFGYKTVKVPFSAGSYYEVAQNLKRGLQSNPNTKLVIRSLDLWGGEYLMSDKEAREPAFSYPDYLYDDYLLNDINYWCNKKVLNYSISVLSNSQVANQLSFDTYSNWNNTATFGKEHVLSVFQRQESPSSPIYLEDYQIKRIQKTIRLNYTDIANEYPNTTFYVFIPPYSICYWDTILRNGEYYYLLEAEKIAIEELLTCSNIKLFSFSNNYDWTCNLENYKDRLHYGEWINSEILLNMNVGNNQLFEHNYKNYLSEIHNFYSNYNYDTIYEE